MPAEEARWPGAQDGGGPTADSSSARRELGDDGTTGPQSPVALLHPHLHPRRLFREEEEPAAPAQGPPGCPAGHGGGADTPRPSINQCPGTPGVGWGPLPEAVTSTAR